MRASLAPKTLSSLRRDQHHFKPGRPPLGAAAPHSSIVRKPPPRPSAVGAGIARPSLFVFYFFLFFFYFLGLLPFYNLSFGCLFFLFFTPSGLRTGTPDYLREVSDMSVAQTWLFRSPATAKWRQSNKLP